MSSTARYSSYSCRSGLPQIPRSVSTRRSLTPYYGVLDLLRHAILQHWLLAADFLQSQVAALVVKLLEWSPPMRPRCESCILLLILPEL